MLIGVKPVLSCMLFIIISSENARSFRLRACVRAGEQYVKAVVRPPLLVLFVGLLKCPFEKALLCIKHPGYPDKLHLGIEEPGILEEV